MKRKNPMKDVRTISALVTTAEAAARDVLAER